MCLLAAFEKGLLVLKKKVPKNKKQNGVAGHRYDFWNSAGQLIAPRAANLGTEKRC